MTKFSFNIEKIVLLLIGLSFFVGTWHAFPMLNVVNDEMYYVGGVLRAMENHTVVPASNDVPYGTLTYLANYVLSVFTISLLFPFFSFSISALKLFLVQSPSVMYFSLRILSAIFSVVILYFVNKILKKEIEDIKSRMFLLVLLFSNIITTTILHTGKMWVLSTLLVIISFYYLNEALRGIDFDNKVLKRNIFLSIFFGFLAISNFPLNFYSLVCVPILVYYFKSNPELIKKIIFYSVVGGIVYILITFFNFESIKNQIISIFSEYHPVAGDPIANLNFTSSFYTYFVKLLLLYPLIILTLLFSIKKGIRNKKLLTVSALYFFTYFFAIVLVANWTSDLSSSLRYLFPLGFFLIFIVASFEIRINKFFYLIGFVSVFFGLLTIYYLSVPTTYNQAYDWVNQELGTQNVVIVNKIPELQLVKNKQSSTNTKPEFCASKCNNIIEANLNSNFKPLVIDLISKDYDLRKNKSVKYYISDTTIDDPSYSLVKSFVNAGKLYHTVDYNLGNYFDLDYLKIGNLGKNLYIYETK